ncbi:hypothetical protein [Candidatus Phytoplasma prunorum]|uniref:hypothetical protein n=1 Tax=Candidatus Phytoplasma prunorum TaxID=47565 RepID=UPI002FF0C55F
MATIKSSAKKIIKRSTARFARPTPHTNIPRKENVLMKNQPKLHVLQIIAYLAIIAHLILFGTLTYQDNRFPYFKKVDSQPNNEMNEVIKASEDLMKLQNLINKNNKK